MVILSTNVSNHREYATSPVQLFLCLVKGRYYKVISYIEVKYVSFQLLSTTLLAFGIIPQGTDTFFEITTF